MKYLYCEFLTTIYIFVRFLLIEKKNTSFYADYIEKMMIYMPATNDISPTLRDIVNQFDEDNRRPPDINCSAQVPLVDDYVPENNHIELGEIASDDDCGPWNLDHDHQLSIVDDNSTSTNLNFTSHQEACFANYAKLVVYYYY